LFDGTHVNIISYTLVRKVQPALDGLHGTRTLQ